MEPGFAPSDLDTGTPHPARMYDYYLGGKDNYAADRELATAVLRAAPEVRVMARENRAFLQRAVRFLAGEAGIRQFLDIGIGIPSAGNVHELAQRVAPGARVAYDRATAPLVLRSHARISAFFAGFDLIEPGLVQVPLWRPETQPPRDLRKIAIYGGVARKPGGRAESNPQL